MVVLGVAALRISAAWGWDRPGEPWTTSQISTAPVRPRSRIEPLHVRAPARVRTPYERWNHISRPALCNQPKHRHSGSAAALRLSAVHGFGQASDRRGAHRSGRSSSLLPSRSAPRRSRRCASRGKSRRQPCSFNRVRRAQHRTDRPVRAARARALRSRAGSQTRRARGIAFCRSHRSRAVRRRAGILHAHLALRAARARAAGFSGGCTDPRPFLDHPSSDHVVLLDYLSQPCFRRTLPSEIHFPFQFSLTYVSSHGFGVTPIAARLAGAISYVALRRVLGSIAIATAVGRAAAASRIVAFLPALCAVIGRPLSCIKKSFALRYRRSAFS